MNHMAYVRNIRFGCVILILIVSTGVSCLACFGNVVLQLLA